MQFFIVYIREAHPSDGWQLDDNIDDDVVFATPLTFGARVEIAGTCVADLGIEFPAVVDDIENHTDDAYTGWPDRLFLVDKEGRLAYKSKPGPWGFDPKELAGHLAQLLPEIEAPILGKDALEEGALEDDAPRDDDSTTAAESATDDKDAVTTEE